MAKMCLLLTALCVLTIVAVCIAQSPDYEPRDPVIPLSECRTRRKGQRAYTPLTFNAVDEYTGEDSKCLYRVVAVKVLFISDIRTKCYYWECLLFNGRAEARMCSLGTHVSEFYEAGETNPCLIPHNQTYGFIDSASGSGSQFDCTRKGFDPNGVPICIKLYEDNNVCRNNGVVISEGSLCWCRCAAGFTGHSCSSRIQDEESTPSPVAVPVLTNSPVVVPLSTRAPEPRIVEEAEETEDERRPLEDDPARAQRQERRERRIERRERKKLKKQRRQSHTSQAVTTTTPNSPAPVVNRTPTTTAAPRAVNIGNGVTVLTPNNDPNNPDDPSNPNAPRAPNAPREPLVPGIAMFEDGEVFIPQEIVLFPQNAATVDRTGKFIYDDPCPNGEPATDFCAEAGGCFNEGRCVNQCLGLQCLCKSPFTAGRRCEQFRCIENIECMHGGTCMRGPLGNDPVAVCRCLPGYRGGMCEIVDEVNFR